METIGSQSLWSYVDGSPEATIISNTKIRAGIGHAVKNYYDLAEKIAELQFRNRDYVLLFRGQAKDHRNNKRNTSLKPTLFRAQESGNPEIATLKYRFKRLQAAEEHLIDLYEREKLSGIERLRRYRLLRWSILQHYEVCSTPLLDVTQSLRIAASFASMNPSSNEVFLFALGVPNVSGAITASSEAGLQIVRLASACPPSAIRPHLQEGYLLGEYPEIPNFDQNSFYRPYEIDFGLRLIAKFRFNPETFWSSPNFPQVTHNALYPVESRDKLSRLTQKIKNDLAAQVPDEP